jgi:hypothetical protein
LTSEFYNPILRPPWHPRRHCNEMAAPVPTIHEVGELALPDLPALPEFSRLVQVDAVGADGADMALTADDAERAALAQRLNLQSMAKLQVDVSLRRTAVGMVRLNVDFSANVVQSCVVTLEPVAARVADRFSLLCEGEQKRGKRGDTEGEVFVDPFGEDPVEPLDDGRIDVGELVAQHLSLSLDPYPRTPGIEIEAAMEGSGIAGTRTQAGAYLIAGDDAVLESQADEGQEKVNPFAVLEGWRSGGQDEGGTGSGTA